MRGISYKVVLAVLLLLMASCTSVVSNSSPVATKPVVAVTNNWTYLSLNLSGTVEDNQEAIGKTILQWETANSGRRIVSLQIIYSPFPTLGQQVLGLSIYSEKSIYSR